MTARIIKHNLTAAELRELLRSTDITDVLVFFKKTQDYSDFVYVTKAEALRRYRNQPGEMVTTASRYDDAIYLG